MAISSTDTFGRPSSSHALRPDSPSLELILRILELTGRMAGEGAAVEGREWTAVEGRELSAWASYISRRAWTDFLSCIFGARRTLRSSFLACLPATELDRSGCDALNKRVGSSFSTFWRLLCFRMVLGRRTCCGFVGKGVAVKIAASVRSGLLSLFSRPTRSFFCDGVRSWRGLRFGVVLLEFLFGVVLGVVVGEAIFHSIHYLSLPQNGRYREILVNATSDAVSKE